MGALLPGLQRKDTYQMNVLKMVGKILTAFTDEHGKDAKLENGDQLVSVCKDAVMILRIEDGELKAEVIIGKPYIFEDVLFEA